MKKITIRSKRKKPVKRTNETKLANIETVQEMIGQIGRLKEIKKIIVLKRSEIIKVAKQKHQSEINSIEKDICRIENAVKSMVGTKYFYKAMRMIREQNESLGQIQKAKKEKERLLEPLMVEEDNEINNQQPIYDNNNEQNYNISLEGESNGN